MTRSLRSWRRPGIVGAVLAGASLLAAACGSTASSSTTSSTTASSSGGTTIGFVVGAEADPFFQSMYVGAAAEAKALGVKLIWQGDPVDYSPATQIPILQQVLALHPNAIVVAPTDPKALNPYMQEAVKEGIKVLNVDSGSSDQSMITSWVTGDNYQGGETAAQALASAMDYAKNCTASSPCTVAVGVSSLTTTTDAQRVAGFKAEIKAHYPNIQVLNDVVSESEPSVAQSGFAQDISAHHLDGIFAVDGTDAEGASAAVKAAGAEGANVKIVGYDAYATNIQSMEAGGQGSLSAIISQQPTLEGKLIIEYAVDALHHKPVPHLQLIPNILLTPSTPQSILQKYQYVQS